MADLIDIYDVRLVVLYNGGSDLLLYNKGVVNEDLAMLFGDYLGDSDENTLDLLDTYEDTKVSDLDVFSNYKTVSLGIFNLCKNGAAKDGIYLHNAKLETRIESVSVRTGYKQLRLTYKGGYRELSKSELARGSRFLEVEV